MTDRRHDVLAELRSSEEPMSILAISRRLGLHPNTVRYHLQSLSDSGQVEQVEPTRHAPGRPPLMFRAHRGMDPSGPRNYQVLAEVLAADIGAEPHPADRALAAGRAWGRGLTDAGPEEALDADSSIDRLVAILDELGFAPERRTSSGESQIGLRHCPFLDLVEDQAQVICPVHLGLMQGVTSGTPVTVESLEPFAEPDLCLAHLAP
jgi:predicted ArsR family transcriptional regulator